MITTAAVVWGGGWRSTIRSTLRDIIRSGIIVNGGTNPHVIHSSGNIVLRAVINSLNSHRPSALFSQCVLNFTHNGKWQKKRSFIRNVCSENGEGIIRHVGCCTFAHINQNRPFLLRYLCINDTRLYPLLYGFVCSAMV